MRVAALIAHQASPLERGFWKDYLITMRPYLLFVSGITGIAGLSLASRVTLPTFLVLGVVFFFAYGLGQALTDCFQMDTDSLSAPERPLVRGTIIREDVIEVSLGGLLVSAVVVVAFNPLNLAVAAMTIFGLLTYTWFKRRWWGGPWYNAWIVSLVVLLGYFAGAGAAGGSLTVGAPLLGTMFVAFAAYANFVLAGYYKDVGADRVTGYLTLPVLFGRRVSAFVSDGIAVGALIGAGVTVLAGGWNSALWPAAPFLVGGMAFSALAQLRLHRVQSDKAAYRAIEPVVHSYILVLAGLAAAHQAHWTPFLVAFYAAFVWTMKRRPIKAQI